MTEEELNRRIAEVIETKATHRNRIVKDRRRKRRFQSVQKTDDLLCILDYGGYAPHRGYIDHGFDGKTLLHSGKHIKYPKSSNCQRWIKKETSRRSRRSRDIPRKGNYYRRLFDYWWTLY